MNIDIHTHVIPREFIELVKRDSQRYQAKVSIDAEGNEIIKHRQGYAYPLYPGFYDLGTRLRDMYRRQIDLDVVSVAPTLYYYWADVALAKEIAQVCNNSMAKMAEAAPRQIKPVATVPLQDVEAAIEELERVVKLYGFKMVGIGTSLEGRNLDEPEFLPFFQKAEELNVAVLFHPYYVGDRPNLVDYYLTNLVGNPLDTTICISRLVLGGVLERCPNSKFIFVHAGGYIPYQRGRLEHGYKVRQESKVILKEPPGKYFDRLYYDSITHWGPALKFVINSHGSNKVMLGSDYPFDMADADPVKTVKEIGLNAEDEQNVLGKNANLLLRLLG